MAALQFKSRPLGALTALSNSTVAVGFYDSTIKAGKLEVWDWTRARRLHTLGHFGKHTFAHTLLPDGRMAVGGDDGCIRVGDPAAWSSATVIDSHLAVTGIVAAQDGSLITANANSRIALWRNGKRESKWDAPYDDYTGSIMLRVIGPRVIAAGQNQEKIVVIQ